MKVVMTLEQYRAFNEYTRKCDSPFIVHKLEFAQTDAEPKLDLEILHIDFDDIRGTANVTLANNPNKKEAFGLGWGLSVFVDIDSRVK